MITSAKKKKKKEKVNVSQKPDFSQIYRTNPPVSFEFLTHLSDCQSDISSYSLTSHTQIQISILPQNLFHLKSSPILVSGNSILLVAKAKNLDVT